MSEIKVNKISPRAACGTVQLGDSGDTFTIPAGASITNSGTASGFGATGAASWNTTVKTGDFTAVAGEGYFVNTTSGAVNVTLPAGRAGSVVAVKDYAKTFDTNAVTLVRNGSDKIGGVAVNATLSTEGLAVTLVFIDSTQGWLVTDNGTQDTAPTATYISASGGNATLTSGDFKTHVFTGPGTFTVSSVGNACGSNSVEYLVVGGGGAGGTGQNGSAGGGGAGGFRTRTALPDASPLNAPANLPVSATGYPIVIGAGGASESHLGPIKPGSNSSFSTITSAGGGAGRPGRCAVCGTPGTTPVPAMNGGSGGGATGNCGPGAASSGNTPPVSPPQGNNGGAGNIEAGTRSGGGGGGAGAAGQNGIDPVQGGAGGAGSFIPTDFVGPTAPSYGETGPGGRYFSGGGGGSVQSGTNFGAGGVGGGKAGGTPTGGAGTANTGGAGGAGMNDCIGSGVGGSGIVMIRYKFQN